MAQVDVTMPKMGESITEGTVIAWHKQPGDVVELDETLLEIGTDKVDTEVPSPSAGKLLEILVPEGETVEVGTKIATLETDVEAEVPAAKPAETPAPAKEEAPAPAASAPAEKPAAPAPAASGSETVEVVMPKMGESITEGTVIAWHKQPGDVVELDETLLEIGTDKVDTEVPSPAAGTLVEILVPEGETVEVGAAIARIGVGEGASVADPAPRNVPAEPELAAPPETPEDAPEAPAYSGGGDGQPAAAGVAGDGGPIVREGESGRFYSPLVRSIAEKEGLSMQELESIPGSGREGRVSKADVLAYVKNRSSAPARAPQAPAPARPAVAPQPTTPQPSSRPPAPAADYGDRVEIVEMDRMRRIIAEHMVRSKATSPHVTSFAEIDVTNMMRNRERNKAKVLDREGVKLTVTPYFMWAAIEALRSHPVLNASVEDTRVIIKKDLHIGMAVAIGKSGLVAPVMRDAGSKNIIGIAKAAADLSNRARNKGLQPDELQGGTFTVTNVGSLGSLMGTPIINQPQVAILATGAIKKRPVVIEDPNVGDVIAIRQMMFVSLSYDHRIIDGAMAASYLQRYVEVLEGIDPNGDL